VEKYSRQLLVLGLDLQLKLRELKITIVGCGALGSALAELLTRLGVGQIKIIDADIVEVSNLHRTHLFDENDVGKPKVLACAEKLRRINSDVKIFPVTDIITKENVEELIKGSDYVFDALDNLYYRLLLNDACVKLNIPLIYGGIMGEYASTKLVIPKTSACLSCFMSYEGNDENACETVGTLDTVVDVITGIQVQLMLNHLRGIENGEYLYYVDMKSLRVDKVLIKRNERCEACSLGEYKYLKFNFPLNCGLRIVKTDYDGDSIRIEKDDNSFIICYPYGKCFKKVSH
jgi:adenylyltransferase/sulfurtransferase